MPFRHAALAFAIATFAACGASHDYVADAPPPIIRPSVTASDNSVLSIVAPPDVGSAPRNAVTTDSGLAYKPLVKSNDTTATAQKNDLVTLYFVGWTSSGRPFDDTLPPAEPLRSLVSKLLPGLAEGLQLMRSGDRFRFWVPQKLAYAGAAGRAAGDLTYDVELIAIHVAEPREEVLGPPPVPDDVAEPPLDAQRTPSGLAYKVLQVGSGPTPSRGNKVTVHYSGWTTDGEMFDSSITRGEAATFPVSGVIAGFSEGLQLMQVGSRVRLWIPESLAYQGKPGAPQGMLVFDIELRAIE